MNTMSGNGSDGHGPYTALSSLKDAHNLLLKRQRKEEEPYLLLDDVEEFLTHGSAAGMYLDSFDDRSAGQSMLDYWVPILYRAKRTPPDSTLAEFDATKSPVLDDSLCPYRGLNAFQEADRDIFFGRQRLIETLVQKIGSQRFLFVIGSSGSGKSSLVLAGFIPVLRNGIVQGSDHWQYLPRVVPGHNPTRNLARALAEHYEKPAEWADQLARDLMSDAAGLERAVSRMNDTPAVLVVDQFEETYTLCTNDAAREAFINNLISFAQAPGRNNLIVVTLRTDYTDYLGQSPELLDLFAHGQVTVTPLTAAELRAAIEEPARHLNLKFENGIVDSLVKDILSEPAGLPLLQFTLLRLWKTREGGRSRITWKAYNKLDGPRNALALTADEVYERLTPANQFAAKKILLRLARPSGNMEVTSNRVKRSDLYFVARDRINEVLDKLSKEGLIRITKGDAEDNDQVEVAHEALVRNWPLLTGWLEAERGAMRQRVRLTSAAEQWQEKNKDEGGLIGGELLRDALAYDDLNDIEREFIQASKKAAERAEREKKKAEEREQQLDRDRLIALEQTAAEQAKNARRLRLFIPVLAALTLFALVTAAYAYVNEKNAMQSAQAAKQSAEASKKNEIAAKKNEQSARDSAQQAVDAKHRAEEAEKIAKESQKKAEEEDARADKNAAELEVALRREKAAKAALGQVTEIYKLHREADDNLNNNNVEDAITKYSEVLNYYHSANDRPNEVRVLISLAKAYNLLSEQAYHWGDNDLKKSYSTMGRDINKDALELFNEEEAKKQSPKGQVADLISLYKWRAQFYISQNNFDKAETDYKNALDLQESLLTSGNSNGLKSYESLVYSVSKLYERYVVSDGREDLYKRALETTRRVLGETPTLDVYRMHRAMANLYYDTRDYPKAESQLKDALDIIKQIPGMSSSSTYSITTLTQLGDVYIHEKKNDLAEDTYKKALQNLGHSDTPEAGDAWRGLALIYRQPPKPRYGDAEDAYTKAAAIYEKNKEDFLVKFISSLSALGELYRVQEKFDKAVPVYEKVMRNVSPENYNYYLSAYWLGISYLNLKKFSEAEAQFNLSLTGAEKRYGKTSMGLMNSLLGLAEASEGLAPIHPDKSGEAEVYYKRALDILKVYDPSLENSSYLDQKIQVLENYAALLQKKHDPEHDREAGELLKHAQILRGLKDKSNVNNIK